MKRSSEFSFPFSALRLDAGSLERAMGYRPGQSPPPVARVVAGVLTAASERTQARAGFVLFESGEVAIGDHDVLCGGIRFATGLLIARQLKTATALAAFVATAGPGLEAWSRQLLDDGELLKGYIADTLGSETAERAADRLMEELAAGAAERDWGLTNRFSPGYCGWNVAEQQPFFSLLPAGFCGVRLTPSSLMIPLKSVSGLIGLGPEASRREYPCAICGKQECSQRLRHGRS